MGRRALEVPSGPCDGVIHRQHGQPAETFTFGMMMGGFFFSAVLAALLGLVATIVLRFSCRRQQCHQFGNTFLYVLE